MSAGEPPPPGALGRPGALPAVVPCDYDSDPGRFAANVASQRFTAGEPYSPVAHRLLALPAAGPVLELGGGPGPLAKRLAGSGVRVVVADLAAAVAAAPRPAVRADAAALGFRPGSFGAVAALWMLYHVPDPARALAEAWRVLRPGGWFVATTVSRFNDPELAAVVPGWGEPLTFDAENAVTQVSRFFRVASTLVWDRPLTHLASRGGAELYHRGHGLSPEAAALAAARTPVPLDITKRGVLIWARKPPVPQ